MRARVPEFAELHAVVEGAQFGHTISFDAWTPRTPDIQDTKQPGYPKILFSNRARVPDFAELHSVVEGAYFGHPISFDTWTPGTPNI